MDASTKKDQSFKKWIFMFLGNCIALRLIFNSQSTYIDTSSTEWKSRISTAASGHNGPISVFDQIANEVYSHDVCNKDNLETKEPRQLKEFDLESWRPYSTTGGLNDDDRTMLARYYASANSVFEWGLGESSKMAGYFNVSRYSGIDSDATYVAGARDDCPTHFRLSFADIGKTRQFGRPIEALKKNQYDYVVAPLVTEQCPFDVYLVDGRFRTACAILALLHSSRGGHDAKILMHDFTSPLRVHASYKEMLRVADVVESSGNSLVALKRKEGVTDEMLHEMYLEFGSNSA